MGCWHDSGNDAVVTEMKFPWTKRHLGFFQWSELKLVGSTRVPTVGSTVPVDLNPRKPLQWFLIKMFG